MYQEESFLSTSPISTISDDDTQLDTISTNASKEEVNENEVVERISLQDDDEEEKEANDVGMKKFAK